MYPNMGQPPPPPRVRPPWIENLVTFYNGRIARQFVLHFNITDFIIDLDGQSPQGATSSSSQNQPYPSAPQVPRRVGEVMGGASGEVEYFREYLHGFLFHELACQAIYTYSLAGGLLANVPERSGVMGGPLDRQMQGGLDQRVQDALRAIGVKPQQNQAGRPQEGQEVNLPDNLAENFKLLGHILRQPYYANRTPGAREPNPNEREAPVAVVLDYAEKLIPFHLGEGHGERDQLVALEVVQRWALDPAIRRTNNLIILLTTNIGQIPASVYAEGSGCRAIRVPLPDEGERAAFIRYKMTRAKARYVGLDATFGGTPEVQSVRLARATQGMRLTDIDNVSRRVIVEARKRGAMAGSEVMRADDVQREKSEVIEAQSAQLLEIIPPTRGFNEIGGLEGLKDYLRKRTRLMLQGEFSPLVPSGLLLAGPPGTGKTIIAEALALDSGFNLVKMRSIRDKWVGSSERNLDLVINLLKDLYPVIVFIDEIDQAVGQRDTGQSGDSGVGARMFARILQEMSNPTNRGRILWVAATNRADIIDEALKRRFDRVVPLLTPDVEESCRIFATMLRTIIKQSDNTIKVAYGGDLQQSDHLDANNRPDPTTQDLARFRKVAEMTAEMGLTGAGLEIVVRRAIEMVYEELEGQGNRPAQNALPMLESRHLVGAVRDYKPNHNRAEYDFQSLLAIRASNFYSVIPILPKTGVYGRIQKSNGQIDDEKLDAEILALEQRARLRKGF